MKPEEMIRELPGRSVEEWIAMLPEGSHTERRAFLVAQGLSSNRAGAVLWWEKNGAAIQAGGGELVDRQYAGAKAALRSIYERVAAFVERLGDDGTVDEVDAELEGWLRGAYEGRG